jgi:hypothetical protein
MSAPSSRSLIVRSLRRSLGLLDLLDAMRQAKVAPSEEWGETLRFALGEEEREGIAVDEEELAAPLQRIVERRAA